jgi:hypothetical protein
MGRLGTGDGDAAGDGDADGDADGTGAGDEDGAGRAAIVSLRRDFATTAAR